MVAVATAIRLALDPIMGDNDAFPLFILPVLVVAWFGGWKPATFALSLSLLVVAWMFATPRYSIEIADRAQLLGLAIDLLVGGAGIGLCEMVRIANRRALSHAAELEHEAAARQQAETGIQRLVDIVASCEDAIIAENLDGIITDWNAGAARLFGYSAAEAVGQNASELIDPSSQNEHSQFMKRRQVGQPYETERRHKDGRTIAVAVTVSFIEHGNSTIGLSTIVRDLTSTKRLESQLQQAQKMEAVGQLAGGIAHDFNNLLTVINGYSEIMLGDLPPEDPMRSLLEEIHKAGSRAASLTRQLLAFSRKQVLEPKVVDLNETVKQIETMLHRLIGEDVQLNSSLAKNLGRVKIDQGQIEQVIVNLAVNARDAMPQGGMLTIETSNVELDEKYAETHPEVWPGRYVLLAVSDTGTGMDAATKARIFEPFFTTKEVGKGTGLGLAVVHGIVKQSDGHVAVYSEPGQGTAFKIYLPEVNTRPAGKSHPGFAEQPNGNETVLLVEDEDAVRKYTRHALETSGYTVLEARHGGEAARLADKYDGSIDLLVSDVVMPEMGGRLLAEHLVATRPGIKVLLLSGYTDDAVVRHGVLEAETAFLQKPFTPVALANKVREVLDQSLSSNGKKAGTPDERHS